MSNIENLADTMIPSMVKFIISVGVILCLISIIISGYYYSRKKRSLKEIKTFFIGYFVLGITAINAGIVIAFMANYDILSINFKRSFTIYCIVSLAASWLLLLNDNKTN